jgi:hypothetical protein
MLQVQRGRGSVRPAVLVISAYLCHPVHLHDLHEGVVVESLGGGDLLLPRLRPQVSLLSLRPQLNYTQRRIHPLSR